MDSNSIMNSYINQSDWRVKENSNTTFSYPGLVGHVANHAMAEYMLQNVYTEEIAKAHRETALHIHDLSGMNCYCLGLALDELLFKGLNDVDGPPKHFSTAMSQMMNAIYLIAQEIAGAIAFNSVDILLAAYIRKDGLTYKQIKQIVQEFVYSINIKGRIGHQTPFVNFQLDATVPKRLKGQSCIIAGEVCDFTYDDLKWEIESFNKALLETMMESPRVLAFPVINMGITKDFNWDNQQADVMFEAIGSIGQPTINNYYSGDYDPDAVKSMCCFDGKQEVMVKKYGYKPEVMSFENAYNRFNGNSSIPIYHNGSWVKGKIIRLDATWHLLYEVVTANNKKMVVTDNHLHLTLDGVKETTDLTTDDYLVVSTMPCESMYDTMSYEMGVLIGAYLGDGSRTEKETILSMNEKKCEVLLPIIEKALSQLGISRTLNVYPSEELRSVRVYGKELPEFISEWVNGDKAYNKSINHEVLRSSIAFREGILFGLYNTDGGNANRIYSVSTQLISDIEAIATTLGIPTIINTDGRVGETVTFPDGHDMKRNYPLHCIRMYDLKGKRKYSGVYRTKNNQTAFKIKSIRGISETTKWVYCCEMEDDGEPFFTLPNGIITHNCSLRLDMSKIMSQAGGQFGAADNSGSIGVVTLNLPLYAYWAHKAYPDVKQAQAYMFNYIDQYLDVAFKSLVLKRTQVEKLHSMGMYPTVGRFIHDFRSFFSTIGVIGMNEMCLNLGMNSIDDEESKAFSEKVLGYINMKLSDFQLSTVGFYGPNTSLIANLELVPGEGVTHRFAKHMKQQYPDIVVANGYSDAEYLTRGCWLPIDKEYPLWFAAQHQDELQALFSGGANFQYHTNERMSRQAAKSIVKKLVTNTTLPFISLSPVIEECPICGKVQTKDGYCEHNLTADEIQHLKDKGVHVEYEGKN